MEERCSLNVVPKVLVISRGAWDDSLGTSSTLSNLFSDYPQEKVAHIYVDPGLPSTKCCGRFFQISEYNMIRRLFNWKVKTGEEVSNNPHPVKNNAESALKEEKLLSVARNHRLHIFTLMRDVLWGFNGWKSKELAEYVRNFNPDIIWLDGVHSTFLNRLYLHVMSISKRPCVLYMMDDNYTYQSMVGYHYMYQFYQRHLIEKIVSRCGKIFVISPKMKREYDQLFGIESVIITKGIDYRNLQYKESEIGNLIKIVYLGQIIYGRLATIKMLSRQLDQINKDGLKVQLHIYTSNYIKEFEKQDLCANGSVVFKEPVLYAQVNKVIEDSDVLLFVESLDKKYVKDARLSFSTKITDYLSSGKCILAIGPEDSASLEYLKNEDAAIVVNNEKDIHNALLRLSDRQTVQSYGLKAFACGKRNHEKQLISQRIMDVFQEVGK